MSLIKLILTAAIEYFRWSVVKMKIDWMNQDHKDDDEIKKELDQVDVDTDDAVAHRDRAELLTARKASRHQIQQLSPL